MSTRIPPLHALKAFESAARHGSFAKAADELCVTRSAVSHRIQLLEELLGAPLFRRKRRALTLTAKGNAYLTSVRKALESLQEIAVPGAGVWPVAVSTPPTFARLVLVPLLGDFLAANPGIELAIHVCAPSLDSSLADADVEIRFGHGAYPHLESHLLLDEPVFPVCTPAYAERMGLRAPADLARASLLRSSLEPWQPWFAAAGLPWDEPAVGPRFEDLALLYQGAADGQGVALARAMLVRPLMESGALKTLFDLRSQSPYAYYVVYPRQSLERPEVASFVNWLRRAVPAFQSRLTAEEIKRMIQTNV